MGQQFCTKGDCEMCGNAIDHDSHEAYAMQTRAKEARRHHPEMCAGCALDKTESTR